MDGLGVMDGPEAMDRQEVLDRLEVLDGLEGMDILEVIDRLREWHKPHMTTASLGIYWMSVRVQHQCKCCSHVQEGNTNGLRSHQS